MLIKSSTRRRLSKLTGDNQPIWQGRFWEHRIRDARDFSTHLDYIHFNPVKHDYVDDPMDWQLSSIREWHDMSESRLDWSKVRDLLPSDCAE